MADTAGAPAGVESSLSNWVGPYVTDMMGRADALSSMPYTAYSGPLTAGESELQTTGFTGYDAMWGDRNEGFDPTAFTSGMEYSPGAFDFSATGADPYAYDPYGDTGAYDHTSWTDQGIAGAYMNPYIDLALTPQMEEARRQAEIQRVNDAGRYTQAGAYGGSRQAIMESELNDNLMRNLAQIYGTGINTAYESGRGQFNTEEGRRMDQYNTDTDRSLGQNRWENSFLDTRNARDVDRYRDQFNVEEDRSMRNYQDQIERQRQQHNFEQGLEFDTSQADRRYGLDLLTDIMRAGSVQRGIESEGVAADMAQFEDERDYPYRMVQYMQSMLQGLPVGTQSQTYMPSSGISDFLGTYGNLQDLINTITGGGSGGDSQ